MVRPNWAQKTAAMQDYYDHYWGFPVHDDRQLFEMLSLELFQAGLTWETIWKRREAFEQAFDNFEIATVAEFSHKDVERLCHNQRIIRNRRKIEAVINNAQVIQQMKTAGKSFNEYIWAFVDGKVERLQLETDELLPTQTTASQKMAKQMKHDGFQFVGPTILYSFMTAVGLINARLS